MAKTAEKDKVGAPPELPEPISGDPEVKVTRIRADGFERVAHDPYEDIPVIQGDPEVTVTRQRGIELLDGGQGVLKADRPAVTPGEGPQFSDQHGAADRDYGFPNHPGVVPGDPNHPSVRETEELLPVVQAHPEVEVTRQKGVQTEKDGFIASDRLPTKDEPQVTLADLPPGVVDRLSPEQRAAFESGVPYRADRPGDGVIVHDPMKYQREMAEASQRGQGTQAQRDRMAAARAAKAAKPKTGKTRKARAKKGAAKTPAEVQAEQLAEAQRLEAPPVASRQSTGQAIKDGGDPNPPTAEVSL